MRKARIEKFTEGSTAYCLLGHLSLPDLDDSVVLKLGDAAGQTDEQVKTPKHESRDEGVHTDDQVGFFVLQFDVAQRDWRLHYR